MIPRIYIASKMHHAEQWRELYKHADIHLVSRWPFLEPFINPEAANAQFFWQDDIADVAGADAVLVYALEGEHLRGALVEAGAGIALGKMVVVVDEHPDYGSWQHHPNVRKAPTLAEAIDLICSAFQETANG